MSDDLDDGDLSVYAATPVATVRVAVELTRRNAKDVARWLASRNITAWTAGDTFVVTTATSHHMITITDTPRWLSVTKEGEVEILDATSINGRHAYAFRYVQSWYPGRDDT